MILTSSPALLRSMKSGLNVSVLTLCQANITFFSGRGGITIYGYEISRYVLNNSNSEYLRQTVLRSDKASLNSESVTLK